MMTDKLYQEKLKILKNSYEAEKINLQKQYIELNSKYKIGDLVEDHYHRIKIESISPLIEFPGKLGCFYKGAVLKKDNTPAKNQTDTIVYSSNIKGGWKKQA